MTTSHLYRNLPGTMGEKKNDADFEEFWAACPRRVAKLDARRKYDLARKLASAADILSAIKRYAEKCKGQPARYICHPATWLAGGRWLDDDDAPTTEGTPQNGPVWTVWMAGWRAGKKYWPRNLLGPQPGEMDCRVPDGLLTDAERAAKNNLDGKKAMP